MQKTDNVSSRDLVSQLRGSVEMLPAGSQLPSVRELMQRYRVGPATVGGVFAQLAAEGLVVTLPGRGTFVAPPLSAEVRGDTDWQLTALGERFGTVDELETTTVAPATDPIPLLSAYLPTDLQPLADLRKGMERA